MDDRQKRELKSYRRAFYGLSLMAILNGIALIGLLSIGKYQTELLVSLVGWILMIWFCRQKIARLAGSG
jgi:hypothetical protein